MKKILRFVLIGILSFIPLFIVIQVVIWLNNLSIDLFNYVSSYTNSDIKTVFVLLVSISIFAIVGASVEKVGKAFLVTFVDKILEKIPAISTIYSILKKITDLVMPSHDSDSHKKEVVLIEYPKKDLWVPAYVLNQHENLFVLFVPTSPNPTSGYTVIVKNDKVVKTTMSIAQVSKFIISMGVDFVNKDEIHKLINESKND